jgi:hypothetical protein
MAPRLGRWRKVCSSDLIKMRRREMMAQVGAGATGWGAAPKTPNAPNIEDGWRSLADVLSQPVGRTPPPLPPVQKAPRRSDWASPVETGVTLAAVAAARAKIPVTEIRGPSRKPSAPEPAWSTAERRLWWMAGGLMLLAVGVLSTLALVTFGRGPAVAAIAPAIHSAVSPAPSAPTVVASAAPLAAHSPSEAIANTPPAKAAPEVAPSGAIAAHPHASAHAAHGAAHRVRHHHRHHAHHR